MDVSVSMRQGAQKYRFETESEHANSKGGEISERFTFKSPISVTLLVQFEYRVLKNPLKDFFSNF